jgi:hypothetical protein
MQVGPSIPERTIVERNENQLRLMQLLSEDQDEIDTGNNLSDHELDLSGVSDSHVFQDIQNKLNRLEEEQVCFFSIQFKHLGCKKSRT